MSEEQFSQRCADKLEAMILAEGAYTVAAFTLSALRPDHIPE